MKKKTEEEWTMVKDNIEFESRITVLEANQKNLNMLFYAFGAIEVAQSTNSGLRETHKALEEYLFPPVRSIGLPEKDCDIELK